MLTIEYSKLNQIKQIDLPELLKSKGITVRHNGNGSYLALCPFHPDKNPSLSISFKNNKWLWHCFGCNKSGTVIDFIRLLENKSFPDIYRELSGVVDDNNGLNREGVSLLNKVVSVYHQTLLETNEALDYLKNRNLLDKDLIEEFKIGFCSGSLKTVIENNPDTIQNLKALGVLNERGNETFYNSITVPIYNLNDQPIGLYGRNISRKAHLYLKGPHKGVFNYKTAKAHDEIILAESIIDALSLIKEGFKNTIASYGTNGFTSLHLELLKQNNVKRVFIAYDNDSSGDSASSNLANELSKEGMEARRVHLPEGIKDINDYFSYNKELDFKGTKDTFSLLIERSTKIGFTQTKEKTAGLLAYKDKKAYFGYQTIDYEVQGINIEDPFGLKVIVTAQKDNLRHTDRLDLYSAKTRGRFAHQAAVKLKLQPARIEEDLLDIIQELEHIKQEEIKTQKEHTKTYSPTEEEQKEALNFLKSPNLIENITSNLEETGYIADDTNKLLAYLIATSRKLEKPLSCIIISSSSTGKSYLMEAIASLMPDEELEFYSRITPQSLYYMDKDQLKHKLLIVDERSGSEEADYAIRNLQTRHKLTLAYPLKDALTGKMKTVVVEMNGPIAFMESSTKHRLNPENTSRCLLVYLDETEEQTKRIHKYQLTNRSLEGWGRADKKNSIIRVHKNSQRLLRQIKVIIPFIDKISFPTSWIKTRRDQDRFLSLIEVVTFLHQYQREVKYDERNRPYIESTKKDYEIAYNLAKEVLLDSLEDLPSPIKAFYNGLEAIIREKAQPAGIKHTDFNFRRRNVREWLNIPDYVVKRYIGILEDLEYLHVRKSPAGGSFTYRLSRGITKNAYFANLTQPKEL